ncbi:ribose 5-phosphate isomerase, type A protein [Actinidia rufa]|uniref:ribose-5-phosphate isomerase n=1 Tax=Actinidia rufa TaxID=165716 RepID=A0A7J0F016_9ERIC|nr:ribose 5-phosphate isomerase, type A protein [Actinidia rufa]
MKRRCNARMLDWWGLGRKLEIKEDGGEKTTKRRNGRGGGGIVGENLHLPSLSSNPPNTTPPLNQPLPCPPYPSALLPPLSIATATAAATAATATTMPLPALSCAPLILTCAHPGPQNPPHQSPLRHFPNPRRPQEARRRQGRGVHPQRHDPGPRHRLHRRLLGALLKSGQLKDIVGIPTSKRTHDQAAALGIPLSTLDQHPKLDLAIDGADEVDPNLDLVKGRGGALLREKMVEAASDKFVVVVDDSKLVSGLGGSGLAMPVEVVQFCWKYNLIRLEELFREDGCVAKLRLGDSDKPYVTDNMNYIVDLCFEKPITDSEASGREISALEGVVEHGLFLNMATAVLIAGKGGLAVKTK